MILRHHTMEFLIEILFLIWNFWKVLLKWSWFLFNSLSSAWLPCKILKWKQWTQLKEQHWSDVV